MKKKKDGYFIRMSIVFAIVFSMIYIISKTPEVEFVNVDHDKDALVPIIGGEIKLGDISVSNRQVKVKEYISSESIVYENFSCNSCASSKEADKNVNGTYKDSNCSGKNPCYINQYVSYSTIGNISYKISTGNWLMSDGDTHYCEGSCTLNAGSSASVCSVSGACPTTITSSKGNKTYETTIKLDGTVLASGKVDVEYCSPTWSDGKETKFFSQIWDRETAIENKEKVYMDDCTPISCSSDGSCSLYRCDRGQWHVRCGANPPAIKVCVYTPSGLGDNSFKYANSYKMTDSPTDEELNYIAFDKDENTCKGCFGNTPTFARSTKTSWSTGPTSSTPYKYDEQMTEEACSPLPEPRVCAPQDYSDSKVSDETDKCEEEKSIFYEDGKKCDGDLYDAFYEIKCVNKVANLFDLNKDNMEVDELNIKQGQSFAYEIESLSSKLCYAKFNSDVWVRAYNNVQNKLKALENESVRVSQFDKSAATQWYITVQSKILAQINDYLSWEPVLKNEPTAEVSLKLGNTLQPLNNPDDVKPENKIIQLQLDEERSVLPEYQRLATDNGNAVSTYLSYKNDLEKDYNGNQIMIKDSMGNEVAIDIAEKYGIEVKTTEKQPIFNVNLSDGLYVNESMPSPVVNLSEVKNFLWITTKKEEDYLIPPSVTLNWVNGSVVANGVTAIITVDGYNRIYTSMDIEKGQKYVLNVKLDDIGTNKSTILDNKCKLNVLNRELIYRVIEETNPFVNDTRKRGYNWYRRDVDGTLYDFTGIILNSDEYDVTYVLDPSDIKTIKKSNKNYQDAYLGTCYLNMNDVASDILCK